MAERDFQLALIELSANIDRDELDATSWDRFALTPDERDALQELMTTQRPGLLLVNQLSHGKQRRQLRDALPTARALAGARLEALIDAFQCNRVAEGGCDLAATMRSFAEFAGDVVERDPDPPRADELVRFEAVCAALSLSSPTAGPPRPTRATAEMRLSSEAALIRCSYDVVAALRGPSPDALLRPPRRCTFLVFNANKDELKIMAVSARLAELVTQLMGGRSVGAALATLEDETAVAAARASITRLLEAGAPFENSDLAPERVW